MAIWLTMCLHELVVVVFFNRIYKRKLKSLPNSKLASVWVYSVFLSLFYMITFHLNQDGYLKYTFLIILTWSHCFHCVFSWPDCWRIWRSLKKLKAQRWNFCVAWRGRSSTWSSDTSTERRSCSRCGWRNILLFTACSAHDCSNVALSYNWPRMIKNTEIYSVLCSIVLYIIRAWLLFVRVFGLVSTWTYQHLFKQEEEE